jgi:hypothetical protein
VNPVKAEAKTAENRAHEDIKERSDQGWTI